MAVAAVASLDSLRCQTYQFVAAFTGVELWRFEWVDCLSPTLAQLHTHYRDAPEDWSCVLIWTDRHGTAHKSTVMEDFHAKNARFA